MACLEMQQMCQSAVTYLNMPTGLVFLKRFLEHQVPFMNITFCNICVALLNKATVLACTNNS